MVSCNYQGLILSVALWTDSPLPFPELLDRGEKYFFQLVLFVFPL